jgi:hypothetical protein
VLLVGRDAPLDLDLALDLLNSVSGLHGYCDCLIVVHSLDKDLEGPL